MIQFRTLQLLCNQAVSMRFAKWSFVVIAVVSLSGATTQADDPQVQVLLPGFEVFELPVRLPNLNNLRYRPDGDLYALGYDGNVWILRDTDGDELEDASHIFFENKSQLRGPVGMAVIPKGHALLHRDGALMPEAQGVVVASKGKVSALLDTDGDDVADTERVIASGWKEIPPNVDTIGVAIHPTDGSIYFGLGTAAYNNPYLLDDHGRSSWKLTSDRGTVQRIRPDLTGRETVCTGVRFTIGMQFDKYGELIATDQEGATWLSNGNPFDELLHIRPGRHYGFPPRHPRHLPEVFDEPSLFDYRPQHQSTCGLALNLARPPVTRTFGPEDWQGDAFITGASRGKLYHTKLIRTDIGEYVAANQILACLSMITVDCTVTPRGDLLVCCHSGGPDWGTGPSGEGKLFLIRTRPSSVPRPTAAWSSGLRECRIVFDRPLDPADLKGIAMKVDITAGRYVTAGDRFEVIRPGYEVVQSQQASPRKPIAVYSASLTADRRLLVLATESQAEAVNYGIQLPGMGRQRETSTPGSLPQEAAIDLDFSLSGVHAKWIPTSAGTRAGETDETNDVVLPYVDFDVTRALRTDVPETERFLKRLVDPGTLTLTTRVDTRGLFLPVTQPGSSLDYALDEDQWLTRRNIRLRCSEAMSVQFRGRSYASSVDAGEHRVALDVEGLDGELPLLEIKISTGAQPLELHAEWFAQFRDGRERSGPLPLHRMVVPWATNTTQPVEPATRREIPQLAEANWGRGRQIFRSEDAMCSRCHKAHGEGGTIGPDLSNLLHRDYDSVVRDIRWPSYAINPDFVSYTVSTKDGRVLRGVLQEEDAMLQIGDSKGNATTLAHDAIEELRPSSVSIMPEGLSDKLNGEQFRDLLTYLLLPPPRMCRDLTERSVPRHTRTDVTALLAGEPAAPGSRKPLRLLLVAGPKDHGPGEHDYPSWLRVWSQLLSAANAVTVDTAMQWPTEEQLRVADTMVIYQKGTWNDQRARAVDSHLEKGGGLVLIHWAIEGEDMAAAFSQRIGLASDLTRTKYRHGPLTVNWRIGAGHPVARNLSRIMLQDESYWNLVAGARTNVLATGGLEEGDTRPPLFWTVQAKRGRVFVSIPGHYSWTFDDPVYRTILLRGIAWVSRESVDRFNELVSLGAEFASEPIR